MASIAIPWIAPPRDSLSESGSKEGGQASRNLPPRDASPAAVAGIRRGLLGLAAIVGTAVAGYMLAGWSFLDAVYMVVITVFGVGYREMHPVDHPGLKVLTIGTILAGCSAGLWVHKAAKAIGMKYRGAKK